MLMGAHDGAVDHGVFVIRIGRQKLEHPAPHPAPGPSTEARVNCLPVAEALRQVAPGCPGAGNQKIVSNVRRWSRGGLPRKGPVSTTNGAKNAHSSSLNRPRTKAELHRRDQLRITARRVGEVPRRRFVHAV